MECFVCGHPDNDPANPVKVKRFQVMYYWCVDPICKRCYAIDTCEQKDGGWDDPDFDQETGKQVERC